MKRVDTNNLTAVDDIFSLQTKHKWTITLVVDIEGGDSCCYNKAVRQSLDYKEKPKEAKPLTRKAKRLLLGCGIVKPTNDCKKLVTSDHTKVQPANSFITSKRYCETNR